MKELQVGDICRTNLSKPGGLVKILSIEPYSETLPELHCTIEHIEDHPYGYSKGTRGGYMAEDLIFIRRDDNAG
jgi:hypothetical protein